MATFIPNITDVFPKAPVLDVDWDFVDKGLQRKNSMFEEGLAKTKNAYNSVLYAPLSAKANIPVRDEYIRQAREKLKSLIGSDFSLPETINAAQNIFSPFWEDKYIVQDVNLTKHYQKQFDIEQGWKNSTDPKIRENYNGIADMYLNNGLEKLVNAPRDDKAFEKLQKRNATPFTNVQRYLEEMAKNTDEFQIKWDAQSPDGGYLVSSVNGERSKISFKNWAEAMIGNNFYEQFRVTGKVETEERAKILLKQNPNLTEDEINDIISKDAVKELSDGYEKRIAKKDTELTELNTLLKSLPATLTPEQQAYSLQIQDNIRGITARKAAIDEEYKYFYTKEKDKLKEYVKGSPDTYFATLAKQRLVDGWATGKASIESKTIKENSAYFSAQNLLMRQKEFELNVLKADRDWQKDQYEMKTGKTLSSRSSTKTGGAGTDPALAGTDEELGLSYIGAGSTNILKNAATAGEAFRQKQDELFYQGYKNVFDIERVLYFTKKGFGLTNENLSYIASGLDKKIKASMAGGTYDYTTQEEANIAVLQVELEQNDAVKASGEKLDTPESLRNGIMIWTQDYLKTRTEQAAQLNNGTYPFTEQQEFNAFVAYNTARQQFDTYAANQENRKKLIETNILNDEKTYGKIINDAGTDIINANDVNDYIRKNYGNLNIEAVNDKGERIKVTTKDLAEAFLKNEFRFTNKSRSGISVGPLKGYTIAKINDKTRDPNAGMFSAQTWAEAPMQKPAEILELLYNRYGSPEEIKSLMNKADENIVPQYQMYQDMTGKMGSTFYGYFDTKKQGDRNAVMFQEALIPANGTIYVEGPDVTADKQVTPEVAAALRSLLAGKESNLEKLVQGFYYDTQGKDGKKVLRFSISDSFKDKEVDGVDVSELKAQNYQIVLSDNITGPLLQELPFNSGMQVYDKITRGQTYKSDPIIGAAGFEFTVTPGKTENPDKVIVNFKYKLGVNERDPATGLLVNKLQDKEEEMVIPLVGSNAKSPDDIVNYMYQLFIETLDANRKTQLDFEAYQKANPSAGSVDKDAFFKQNGIIVK
jgi:hypothetical protein